MPAPLTGQVAVTGTAQQLDSPRSVTSFTIKATYANAHPVFIGPAGVTTSTGYQLDPGDTFEYECQASNNAPTYQLRPSDFYVVGVSGDSVSWLASP